MELSFGEDDHTVYLDVEGAAAARDQLRQDPQLTLDLGRHPGGPGLVVSDYAVLDRYGHGFVTSIGIREFNALRREWMTQTIPRCPWGARRVSLVCLATGPQNGWETLTCQ